MTKGQWFLVGMAACIVLVICMAGMTGPGNKDLVTVMLTDHLNRIIELETEIEKIQFYDPNDKLWQFMPRADESWTRRFGDNKDTRIAYNVSEIRFVMAQQNQRLQKLENPAEPNEPSDDKDETH